MQGLEHTLASQRVCLASSVPVQAVRCFSAVQWPTQDLGSVINVTKRHSRCVVYWCRQSSAKDSCEHPFPLQPWDKPVVSDCVMGLHSSFILVLDGGMSLLIISYMCVCVCVCRQRIADQQFDDPPKILPPQPEKQKVEVDLDDKKSHKVKPLPAPPSPKLWCQVRDCVCAQSSGSYSSTQWRTNQSDIVTTLSTKSKANTFAAVRAH